MKRVKVITASFMFILLVISSIYVLHKIQKSRALQSNSEDQNSLFLVENTDQNIISLQIPEVDKMTDEEITFLQEFITEKVFEVSGENFRLDCKRQDISHTEMVYTGYYIDIDSQVTRRTDNCISVVFKGLYNKKTTAHPRHLLYAVNYNPNTLEIYNFDNTYVLTEQLYEIFSDLAKANILKKCGGIWPEEWGTFEEEICTKESFLQGMKEGTEFYYYYTETGVVISFPVSYMLGDYQEVEIPYGVYEVI